MSGTRRAHCLLHLRRWNFDPLGGRRQAKLSETRPDGTRRDETKPSDVGAYEIHSHKNGRNADERVRGNDNTLAGAARLRVDAEGGELRRGRQLRWLAARDRR